MAGNEQLWSKAVSLLAGVMVTMAVAITPHSALSSDAQVISVVGDANIPYVSYLVGKAATHISATHPWMRIEHLPALDMNQAMLRSALYNDTNDVMVLSFDSFTAF